MLSIDASGGLPSLEHNAEGHVYRLAVAGDRTCEVLPKTQLESFISKAHTDGESIGLANLAINVARSDVDHIASTGFELGSKVEGPLITKATPAILDLHVEPKTHTRNVQTGKHVVPA
jgi:hypothetical protein